VGVSKKGLISNIFAIERKEERENISKWDKHGNKMLLWHGTKAENMVGILQTGFRISPPEASQTGNHFGKGLYFADNFSKSYQYTHNYSNHYYYHNQKKKMPKKYLLLCEVALGKMKEVSQLDYNNKSYGENIPGKEFHSIKALGNNGPDMAKSIYLSSGCIIPLGNIVNYNQQSNLQGGMARNGYSLQHNEYIVYDTT
jgi:hypothetical protein